MNATSTHDTKRSEDVRARIDVISEIPEEWANKVAEWHGLNQRARATPENGHVPSRSTELLFYQTLLGAWPLDSRELPQFGERINRFMAKAAREAKQSTSWLDPDERYEAAVATFISRALDPELGRPFLDSFLPFQESVAFHGALNSLSQVVLKVAAPGVPDFYQGSELWDFSMADPDNRRAVAFDRRVLELAAIDDQTVRDRGALCAQVIASWKDGRIKLYTTMQSLRTRSAARQVFEQGAYAPLTVSGANAGHVCGSVRLHEGSWAAAVVPRLTTRLVKRGTWPLGGAVWGPTVVNLPEAAPALWGNVFTGAVIQADLQTRELPLADVFAAFPVALLRGV